MAELTSNQPGTYTLKSFKIWNYELTKSVELTGSMFNFTITESMSNGAIKGSALIVESQGLIDSFPFIGEEVLEITYADYFGYELKEIYMIYAIDNVSYGDDKKPGFLSYTIYFTSPHKFFSENERVQRAYRDDVISSYVFDLYNEYMLNKIPSHISAKFPQVKKQIEIEPTINQRTLVVPKMNPEGAMHFFSRNAFTTVNPLNSDESSLTYRFFEARDKFYFATIEYMRSLTLSPLATGRGTALEPSRGILKFYRNYDPNLTPEGGAASMAYILNADFSLKVNTIGTIVNGGYRRKVYEFNMLTMSVDPYEYDYTESYNDKSLGPIHTERFIKEAMQKQMEIFIPRDYREDDPHYRELYTKKPIYFYNQDSNTISVKIYGRNDLFAGSTVDVSFIKHVVGGVPAVDEERSGLWFVEGITSVFDGNIFTQNLTLTRGGISK
jgi:hypothetical protein